MGDGEVKGRETPAYFSSLASLGGSSSGGCTPPVAPASIRQAHQISSFCQVTQLLGSGSFSVSHQALVLGLVTASRCGRSLGCPTAPCSAAQLLHHLHNEPPILNSLWLKHLERFLVPHLGFGCQRACMWPETEAGASVTVEIDTVSATLALPGKVTGDGQF